MIYLNYNEETGEIYRAYHHSCKNIPQPNIEVADDVWRDVVNSGKLRSIKDGVLVLTDKPPVIIDTTAFDAACKQFRYVCEQIRQFIGAESFMGGFDEYAIFITSEAAQNDKATASLLANMWSGANEYAKYEGSKIGYGQPEWWYRCWDLSNIETKTEE